MTEKSETPKFDKDWEILILKQEKDWKKLNRKPDVIPDKTDVSKFLRLEKLNRSDINPLLVIRAPRDIPKVQECFDKLKIDKLWVRYYNDTESHQITRRYVSLHPEYTHIILISDDVYVSPEALDILLDDICTYDFPAISGQSNMCDTYRTSENLCSFCRDGKKHPLVNVIFEPIAYLDSLGHRSPYISLGSKPEDYDFLTNEFVSEHQEIVQCFFQGHSLCAIRKDIFEKYGCKSYIEGYSDSDDFAFAVDMLENDIPQFADLRISIPHDARYHNELMVGQKEPTLKLETSNGEIKIVGGAINGIQSLVYTPILICTPFNNEDQSIDMYIQSLLAIDYPKEFIDLVWVENDSVDKTWVMLQKYAKIIEKKGYRSFTLVQQDYGLKKFGKSTMRDFRDNAAGKNKVTEFSGRVERGKRLCKIYHYFFEQLKPDDEYIMFLFADVVVPMQIIKRYLEIFRDYRDAGWVGGVHHKRFPLHMRSRPEVSIVQAGVAGPLRRIAEPPYVAYVSDKWILEKQMRGEVVFEVAMVGHAWMMLPRIFAEGGRTGINTVEIIMPLIEKTWEMGLKVYCASDIYLQHISLDGKIYRRNLLEELEYHKKIQKDEKKQRELTIKLALVKRYMQDKDKNPENQLKQSEEDKKAVYSNLNLIEYLDFIDSHPDAKIPPRPASLTRKVVDPVSGHIIDQNEWDRLYGKWKKFIDEKTTELKKK